MQWTYNNNKRGKPQVLHGNKNIKNRAGAAQCLRQISFSKMSNVFGGDNLPSCSCTQGTPFPSFPVDERDKTVSGNIDQSDLDAIFRRMIDQPELDTAAFFSHIGNPELKRIFGAIRDVIENSGLQSRDVF